MEAILFSLANISAPAPRRFLRNHLTSLDHFAFGVTLAGIAVSSYTIYLFYVGEIYQTYPYF